MTRTNLDIDDELIDMVMKQNGLKTKKDAVEFALRNTVRIPPTVEELMALHGIGFSYSNDEIEGFDGPPES